MPAIKQASNQQTVMKETTHTNTFRFCLNLLLLLFDFTLPSFARHRFLVSMIAPIFCNHLFVILLSCLILLNSPRNFSVTPTRKHPTSKKHTNFNRSSSNILSRIAARVASSTTGAAAAAAATAASDSSLFFSFRTFLFFFLSSATDGAGCASGAL
jgi:hypothetical protein